MWGGPFLEACGGNHSLGFVLGLVQPLRVTGGKLSFRKNFSNGEGHLGVGNRLKLILRLSSDTTCAGRCQLCWPPG